MVDGHERAGTPRPRKKSRARWVWGCLGAGVLGVMLFGGLTFCVGGLGYYSSKYSGVGPGQPLRYALQIVPEVQTEPHTCGLHSIRSTYRAYGVDPDMRRLRFRLGTDKPFNNLVEGSEGTIHPDMLRVMRQDGFLVETLNPLTDESKAQAAVRVREHLDAGQLVIALTKVNEFHWVVLCGREGDDVLICDSLEPEIYAEPFDEYLTERVYSVLLVGPG